VLHTLAAFAVVPRLAGCWWSCQRGHFLLIRMLLFDSCMWRFYARWKVFNDWLRCWIGVPRHRLVLVHDAARCLITPGQIDTLIDACQGDAVGGLLALKLPDTLKREAAGGWHRPWSAATSGWRRLPRCFASAPCNNAVGRR